MHILFTLYPLVTMRIDKDEFSIQFFFNFSIQFIFIFLSENTLYITSTNSMNVIISTNKQLKKKKKNIKWSISIRLLMSLYKRYFEKHDGAYIKSKLV